ncbi:MAG: divalent-cation tolerance protein CutA [Gammaproteobacteria bacterium]|nr:divalent-cation tolerance protein CutA [Gammaproteobacteria bacterium]
MSDNFHIVLCTCPDKTSASNIARILVENQQCACVNIIPGVESVYQWKGQIESSQEHLLIIKSIKTAYPRIEQHILANHPYELPEIIAVSIEIGLPSYLSWINDNVRKN